MCVGTATYFLILQMMRPQGSNIKLEIEHPTSGKQAAESEISERRWNDFSISSLFIISFIMFSVIVNVISLGGWSEGDFPYEEDEHRRELERSGGVEDCHLQGWWGEKDSWGSVGQGEHFLFSAD